MCVHHGYLGRSSFHAVSFSAWQRHVGRCCRSPWALGVPHAPYCRLFRASSPYSTPCASTAESALTSLSQRAPAGLSRLHRAPTNLRDIEFHTRRQLCVEHRKFVQQLNTAVSLTRCYAAQMLSSLHYVVGMKRQQQLGRLKAMTRYTRCWTIGSCAGPQLPWCEAHPIRSCATAYRGSAEPERNRRARRAGARCASGGWRRCDDGGPSLRVR